LTDAEPFDERKSVMAVLVRFPLITWGGRRTNGHDGVRPDHVPTTTVPRRTRVERTVRMDDVIVMGR